MLLTTAMIKRIMPYAPKSRLDVLMPILNQVALHYEITTARRIQFWLATLAIESGEFKYTSELGTHPEYEGRADLGNNRKGDGIKFEGHGSIQLTGRDVHTEYTAYLQKSGHLPFVDFVVHPTGLAGQPYALDSAGWFVNGYKDLNPLADADKFLEYQVKVNGRNRKTGKPNHWIERQEYLRRGKLAIPAGFVLSSSAVKQIVSTDPIDEAEQADDYPDFEIPATPQNPNIVHPNGEDVEAVKIDKTALIVNPQETGGIEPFMNEISDKDGNVIKDKRAIIKPPNFFQYIWQEITGSTIGTLGIDGTMEKAQEAQALGLPASFWSKVIYFVIAGVLLYFAIKVYRHYQAKKTTRMLIEANTTDTNIIKLIDGKDALDYEKVGYQIIGR